MSNIFSGVITLLALTLLYSGPVSAQSFLHFPADCTLGTDCWIVNYVDMDTAEGSAQDFRCGPRSYDAHKGTDIALRSRAEMRAGVHVLAPMDGTVLRLRDGESDTAKSKPELDAIHLENKDCGNGIMMDHENGIQTMVCHLKNGSIRVKPGDTIKTGDILAEIGQSGFTEFPHLHISVLKDGNLIDPFTGVSPDQGCGSYRENWWAPDQENVPAYEPVSIFHGGFRDHKPDFDAIRAGEQNPDILPRDGDALVFWAGFYGVQKGDILDLSITDPAGQVFVDDTITMEKNRALHFQLIGRTLKDHNLAPGQYTGTVTLTRSRLDPLRKDFLIELR